MLSEKHWVDYVPKNVKHFTYFPSSPGSTLHTGKLTFSSLETLLRTPWLVSKVRFVVADEAGHLGSRHRSVWAFKHRWWWWV